MYLDNSSKQTVFSLAIVFILLHTEEVTSAPTNDHLSYFTHIVVGKGENVGSSLSSDLVSLKETKAVDTYQRQYI
jgi:hypothetical protein